MGTMRKIKPMQTTGIVPAPIPEGRPEFRWVDPGLLFVDAGYQRNLGEKSAKLIRKIVAEWNWSAYKPPVTVDVDGKLHVVDGQHTATAAASHPEILFIPVMVVSADDESQRASAFVRHNRDRVNVTPMQLHYSLLAAGDEQAIDVNRACSAVGVQILKTPPSFGRFRPGETLAIAAIKSLVNRRFIVGAKRVLQVCFDAKLAPISSDSIKAVEQILFSKEYADAIEPDALAATIRNFTPEQEADVAAFKTAHRVPKWRALAVIYFRNTRKKRRAK